MAVLSTSSGYHTGSTCMHQAAGTGLLSPVRKMSVPLLPPSLPPRHSSVTIHLLPWPPLGALPLTPPLAQVLAANAPSCWILTELNPFVKPPEKRCFFVCQLNFLSFEQTDSKKHESWHSRKKKMDKSCQNQGREMIN